MSGALAGNPHVAVVIPAWRAAATLPATIASARAQKGAQVEVIVVDDGSDDDSGSVAKAAGARVIRQDNAGPAAARNRGVASTDAPFIAFLDADDRFLPGKLAAQLAALSDCDAEAAFTDVVLVRDADTPEERGGACGSRRKGPGAVPERLDLDHLLLGNPLVCSSAVVKREAFEAAGGFDPDPVLVACEDYDLWLKLAARRPLLHLDGAWGEYRLRAGSLSDNRRFLKGVDRILDRWETPEDPERTRRIRSRRAGLRLDLAWDLARQGEGAEARRLLAEARGFGVGGLGIWRRWLRTWL